MQSRTGVLLLGVFILLWALGGVAWAHINDAVFNQSGEQVVPYYNAGAGKASFLIVHCAGGQSGADCNILVNFYDQACDLKADGVLELTPFDTEVIDIANTPFAGGVPSEGAIVMSADEVDYMVAFVNVDVVAGTAYVLPAINDGAEPPEELGWGMYDRQAIVILGPTDDGTTTTVNVTLSCPQGDMGDFIDAEEEGEFEPASGLLDLFIFDTDEGFLGSLHNVECECFTRKRLRDWAPLAATQDVVVYFQESSNEESIAGIIEVTVNAGAQFFVATYLHHQNEFFLGDEFDGGEGAM